MLGKLLIVFSAALIISGFVLIASKVYLERSRFLSPVISETAKKPLPLTKYSIENLKKEIFPADEFLIAEELSVSETFTSNLFFIRSKNSSVSGLINIPKVKNPLGTVILLRGYVDREIYETGLGTKRIGEKLASSGFVTVAPDFLGYGKSSFPSILPLEERFQTYTTILSLLNSLPDNYKTNIGLFGHSNGGHIALAILEITGKSYPAVLWAPVGKPFPFSILAFTDEYEDRGKTLRKILADFETDYDIEKYSIDKYFDLINAPMQIHQGLSDQEVPFWWSDELVQTLKNKNKEVEYFKYPGEDHNFNQGTWETLASRTLNFYIQQFSKQ